MSFRGKYSKVKAAGTARKSGAEKEFIMHINDETGHGHTHEHTHEHTHSHVHADGTVHTHAHEHVHSHEHTHEHLHADGTVHTHSHEAPKDADKVKALLNYMVEHNEHHADELADLLDMLPDKAKDKLTKAIGTFEAANVELRAVLEELE